MSFLGNGVLIFSTYCQTIYGENDEIYVSFEAKMHKLIMQSIYCEKVTVNLIFKKTRLADELMVIG